MAVTTRAHLGRAEPVVQEPVVEERDRADQRFVMGLGLVALVAAVWRASYVWLARNDPPSTDGFAYSMMANLLADGEGFRNPFIPVPTALHPPGWTAVLGVASALGLDTMRAHQFVGVALGVTSVVVVGLLGRELAGPRAGLLAAAAAAMHPELWIWGRELASEALLLPLATIAVLFAYRYLRRPRLGLAAGWGALCGLLVLTRSEQGLLLVLLVAPVVLLLDRSTTPRRRVGALALAGASAIAVVLPWVVHNQARFEEPVFIATGAGITLGYANTPVTYYGPRLGYGDPAVWGEVYPGDESQTDSIHRRKAIDYMSENRSRLPLVVAAREGRTWGFFHPGQQARLDREWGHSPRWVYDAGRWFYWASLPLAAVGAWVLRRRRVPVLPLSAPLVTVAVYVAITYGQTRYRVTADVIFVVLAAVAVDALLRRRDAA